MPFGFAQGYAETKKGKMQRLKHFYLRLIGNTDDSRYLELAYLE